MVHVGPPVVTRRCTTPQANFNAMWSNSGSTVSFRARNLPRPVSTKQIKSDYFSFSKRRYRTKNFFQLLHNIVLDVMQKAYLNYRTCSLNFFTFFLRLCIIPPPGDVSGSVIDLMETRVWNIVYKQFIG